jgi:Ca-activated chloride channel family protein
MQGLGNAFYQADIKKAIRNGPHGRIAVAAIQWSDADQQRVIIPWRMIASDADADALGKLLSSTPRIVPAGGTSISMALDYSAKLLTEAPSADRRIIDVSSDGRNNVGPPVSTMRDEVVAKGITINAVVIMNEWPTLDVYFDKSVVGGEGHFVIPASDYTAYAEAIYHKLLREIVGPGIS